MDMEALPKNVGRKIRRFLRLSPRRKILLFSVFVLSFYTFLLMRFFRKRARFNKDQMTSLHVNEELIRDICWAIFTVSRKAPWENVCRHQAYQAMVVCRYYRMPYEIFIGFRKNPDTGAMEGHAWTRVNDHFVTGFCNPEEYTVQSIFSNVHYQAP